MYRKRCNRSDGHLSFIIDGWHVKNDIPEKLEALKTCNPNVMISFGKSFGVHERIKKDVDVIIVIPYLLFTGILIRGMEKTIRFIQSDKEIILFNYLGFHPYLKEILADRVNKALEQGGTSFASNYG